MNEYLDKIAAWMVPCPCSTADTENGCVRCKANFRVVKGYCRPLCKQCRNGSGRIPDSRLGKLRRPKSCDDLGHVVDAQHKKIYCDCYVGYTVNEDLAVLLEIADTIWRGTGGIGTLCAALVGAACGPVDKPPLSATTIRELLAEAMWNRLVVEEKEKLDFD